MYLSDSLTTRNAASVAAAAAVTAAATAAAAASVETLAHCNQQPAKQKQYHYSLSNLVFLCPRVPLYQAMPHLVKLLQAELPVAGTTRILITSLCFDY